MKYSRGPIDSPMAVPMPPTWCKCLLLLFLPTSLPHCSAITQEDTPLDHLAAHDGMLLFNGAVRKTIPPQAPSGSPSSVAATATACACSDAAPRNESLLFGIDCFHQRTLNTCDADYMKSFLQELNYDDGFCQISCSKCKCCTSPSDVLSKIGATRFLQAAEAAQPPLNTSLDHPGYMATILVPTDAAWEAALKAYPQALQDPSILQQILKFHILPVEPVHKGLWKSPFMSVGATLFTSMDGNASLTVEKFPLPAGTTAYGGLTGFTIQGPMNSAKVIASDIASCKSYITVIDTVLLPFPVTALGSASGGSALGAAMGAPMGSIQGNSGINGTVVKDGNLNRQRSIADCSESCQKTQGCNAFRYCSQRGGCTTADGTPWKFGYCLLQYSAEVASGNAPVYYDFEFDYPFASGYLPQPGASQVAAASAAAGR